MIITVSDGLPHYHFASTTRSKTDANFRDGDEIPVSDFFYLEICRSFGEIS